MPLSLCGFELLAALAGRSSGSGAADAARESFLEFLSLIVWRGGDAMCVVSSDIHIWAKTISRIILTAVNTHPAFAGRCSL
jgi:hypothetical protein